MFETILTIIAYIVCGVVVLVGIIIAICILYYVAKIIFYIVRGIWLLFHPKAHLSCPNCKKKEALELYKEGHLKNRRDILLTQRDVYKNNRHEAVGYREYYCDGVEKTYVDIYKCKFCGHKVERNEEIKKYRTN